VTSIVDDFAPHCWVGPHAPQERAAEYDKHALATGVSDGSVKYGVPTRTEIESDVAYVIVPTIYSYKEHGQPLAEEGQMTFVLHADAGGWKISSWTWSGVKPHIAKSPLGPEEDQFTVGHSVLRSRNSQLLLTGVGVEKLDRRKMVRKNLALGCPTNDDLCFGRHFLSPRFRLF